MSDLRTVPGTDSKDYYHQTTIPIHCCKFIIVVHSGVKTHSDDLVLYSGEYAVKNTEFINQITRLESSIALSSHTIIRFMLAKALDPLATSKFCHLCHGSASGHHLHVTNQRKK